VQRWLLGEAPVPQVRALHPAAVLAARRAQVGSITRDDVAALVVKALFSPKTDNKVLSAVDKNALFAPKPVESFL
jgi:hypothetical protein